METISLYYLVFAIPILFLLGCVLAGLAGLARRLVCKVVISRGLVLGYFIAFLAAYGLYSAFSDELRADLYRELLHGADRELARDDALLIEDVYEASDLVLCCFHTDMCN